MRIRTHFTMIAAIIVTACAADTRSYGQELFSLRLERGPCFGFCPVYELTINTEGNVLFKGIRNTRFDDAQIDGQVSKEGIDRLIREVESGNFFAVGEPECEQPSTDHASLKIEVIQGDRQRQLSRYLGCESAPTDSVVELAQLVDELAGTDRWTRSYEAGEPDDQK